MDMGPRPNAMDTGLRVAVEAIHRSPTMAAVIASGGGAWSLAWLLGAPGASRTLLDVQVPYSAAAMGRLLGRVPDKAASRVAAEDIARTAYARALDLRPDGARAVGIGATAAIATDRPRRGEHRCFVASWTAEAVTVYGIDFIKGYRDRRGEDEAASRLIVRALAEACGVDAAVPVRLRDDERIEVAARRHGDPVDDLIEGRVDSVTIRPDGAMLADAGFTGGVLAGSFDPLHDGHRALARAAAGILEAEVAFELSVLNVDKPPLTRAEADRRAAQFAGDATVVLTRAPAFRDKARLFPGCAFVVGWDTAARLPEPRYYGGDEAEMGRALAAIHHLGCRFLVAGRVHDGAFRSAAGIRMPEGLEGLVTPIPEQAFRCDVSSTELRLAASKP